MHASKFGTKRLTARISSILNIVMDCFTVPVRCMYTFITYFPQGLIMYSDTDLNSFDSFSNLLQRVCILPDS